MCGNTNIDDGSEYVLEITLWVTNGCTRVLEHWTGRKHDVMSSVPKPTSMCGNADINDTLEHVWEITQWVINGLLGYQKTQQEEIKMSCQVHQNPPTCVDDVTPARP